MTDRYDEAVDLLRKAHARHLAGGLADALAGYRKARVLAPGLVDAEYFLAIGLFQSGAFAGAAGRFASLAARRERMPDAAVNLGHAHAAAGEGRAAAIAYRRAVAWAGSEPAAWLGMGHQATVGGDLAWAAICFQRTLALDPADPVALGNVGGALAGLGRPAAGRWQRRALAMAPDAAMVWINAGHGIRGAGDWPGAGRSYRRANAITPHDALALSESIHADLQVAQWDGLARRLARLVREIERGDTVPPFHLLALELPVGLRRVNAERWCHRYPTAPRRWPSSPSGPLKLGYLSGDFRRHAVAYEIVEMIERHDRARVSLHGYGWSPSDGSDVRARLDRAFGGIVDLAPLGDEAAAARIAADDIDVLIDLAGHTHGARPGIVARRPAAVQASYFGFPGTTGAPFHDYALVDGVIAPAGGDSAFSESLVRLPGCYWPHDSTRPRPEAAGRRALGLAPDAVVLACFNQTYKIQPESFGLWMKVMHAAPKAVLWLLDAGSQATANLRREAAAAGVDPGRLIFAPQMPIAGHLARLQAADLVIDTLPYNAHTTASDALTVGCPVVTRIGNEFAGRVCASMLAACGFGDLVAGSADGYVDMMTDLASDPRERSRLRERLEERLSIAPLFDAAGLSHAIEAAAQEMHRRASAGQPPAAFVPGL